MTKREARSQARAVGMRCRERGQKVAPKDVAECAPEACRVLGEEIAHANAVNGWMAEDKRRAARRRPVTPPKNEE